MDEGRVAKLDRGLLIVWVAVSLLGRRFLPVPPAVDVTTEATMLRLATYSAAEIAWWPLILFAAGLPLAASSFHRSLQPLDDRRSRLGFWLANAGFVGLVIGLSLNAVEWTFAAAYLEESVAQVRIALLDRFRTLWLADGIATALSVWLLSGWMALSSWIALRSRPPLFPSWFAWGALASALVSALAGSWGIATLGSIRAVDGGDALLLIHLWIGLVCSLLWEARRIVPARP